MNNQNYCECLTWARIDIIEKSGLPIANHHPNCEHYKLETFYKICAKGGKYGMIVEFQDEFDDIIDGEIDEYDVSTIQMTRDQFDRIEEFEGF